MYEANGLPYSSRPEIAFCRRTARPAGVLAFSSGKHFAGRVRALDAAWQLMAERQEEAGQDSKLSFEVQPNGRLKLNVDRLGALGESKSLR